MDGDLTLRPQLEVRAVGSTPFSDVHYFTYDSSFPTIQFEVDGPPCQLHSSLMENPTVVMSRRSDGRPSVVRAGANCSVP